MTRRNTGSATRRLVGAALVLGAAALLICWVIDGSGQVQASAFHLIPVVLLLVPLLFGRYVGEKQLERLRGLLAPRRRRAIGPALLRPTAVRVYAETLTLLPWTGRPPPACVDPAL